MARRQAIVGNWKMNGTRAALGEAEALAGRYRARAPGEAEVALCPPFTLIADMARALQGSAVILGAQDCHPDASGAHTGDVAAEMIADLGARLVIVGHSERRADHGETDAVVRAKAEAAMRAGLVPIVCVGETEAERDAGRAEAVVAAQTRASLPDGAPQAGAILAYEPVWAIGSGRAATIADIVAMHAALRAAIARRFDRAAAEATRILYGGSVKPANAAEILSAEGVDGALVGGASLKAQEFAQIVECARGP